MSEQGKSYTCVSFSVLSVSGENRASQVRVDSFVRNHHHHHHPTYTVTHPPSLPGRPLETTDPISINNRTFGTDGLRRGRLKIKYTHGTDPLPFSSVLRGERCPGDGFGCQLPFGRSHNVGDVILHGPIRISGRLPRHREDRVTSQSTDGVGLSEDPRV